MKKVLLLLVSHAAVAAVGFAAGIYVLPILTEPTPPTLEEVRAIAQSAPFRGTFHRDLEGSDMLHWGEGDVAVSPSAIAFQGTLAPGPDYKLYLSPEFVATEADFNRLKARMARIGDVETFHNFVVAVPGTVNLTEYNTVIVWCETFGQFITATEFH